MSFILSLFKMVYFIALVLVAFVTFFYYLRNINNYWLNRGVKQGHPWLLFGDSRAIFFKTQSFPEMVAQLYNDCPGTRYSGFYQFTSPTLLVKDPDLIKQITVKEFDHFLDHRLFSNEDVDPLLGKNLFNLKGRRWRDMRGTLTPAFTSSKMRHMYVLIKETSENFVNFFLNKNHDSHEIELKETFTHYASDVIASTAFGFQVDSMQDPQNEFYLMGNEASDFTKLYKSLKIFLTLILPKFMKVCGITLMGRKVNNYFINLIDNTLKQRKEHGIVRLDVIHLLMEAQKGNLKMEEDNSDVTVGFATAKEANLSKSSKVSVTNLDIAAQAMVFFFAGLDAVSSLMCLVAYELGANPDIQSKLRQEIVETFENNNGNISYEALLKMKYMDMVVSETLRKWPITVSTDRICTKPYTIEPKTPDEQPIRLKEGDLIWFSIFGLHRDPQYYPDPERFDPERFNDENKKNINPYTYLPFGIGPRSCIGSRFVLLETKAVFCNLLRHFEIVPIDKMEMPFVICKNSFNIKAKNGYWFRFNRLQN